MFQSACAPMQEETVSTHGAKMSAMRSTFLECVRSCRFHDCSDPDPMWRQWPGFEILGEICNSLSAVDHLLVA